MENKAMVAGILSIVSGALGVLNLAVTVAMVLLFNSLFRFIPEAGPFSGEVMRMVVVGLSIYGVFQLLLSALGVVGGVYAIKRRMWGLALAGAIAGILTFYPTGIAAVILVAMGRGEFGVDS